MTGIAPWECISGDAKALELQVKAALTNWRRKAIDFFMASSALVYLPVIILVACGFGPPLSLTSQFVVYATYSVLVLTVVLKNLDHRIRLYTVLSMAYLADIVGVVAYPGPFMRVLPVALPIIGLVLGGVRCGRLTTLLSILVILLTPFITTLPVLTSTLRINAVPPVEPVGLMLAQGVGLTAMLLLLMVLLEQFYGFLVKALIDQQQSANDIKRKVLKLTEAQDTLSKEIDERRKLEWEVTRIADEEKRRLGLEIHDGVCQQITGALLRSEALARRLDRGQPPTVEDVTALSVLLEEAIDEAHVVAKGLCPLESNPNAIAASLRTLTRRTQRISGVSCRFITTGDTKIPDPVIAQHLFRIAQEAVSNAVRHAHATRINLELLGAKEVINLKVEDDGDGLPAVLPPAGMGMHTMACRARLLEGEFTVKNAPGGGTCVRCAVPRTSLSPPVEKSDQTGDVKHG